MPEPDDIEQMVKDTVERAELDIQFRIALMSLGRVDLPRLIALLDKAIERQDMEKAPHPYMVEEGWDGLWKMRALAKIALEFNEKAVKGMTGLIPRGFNRSEYEKR